MLQLKTNLTAMPAKSRARVKISVSQPGKAAVWRPFRIGPAISPIGGVLSDNHDSAERFLDTDFIFR
jgi:hypothetical protein